MAASTEETAEARRAEKRERDRQRTLRLNRQEAVRQLYRTAEGRDYLRWLLEVSKAIGQQPFQADPYRTAFGCGEINVGHQLMAHMVEVDVAAFSALLKEQGAPHARPDQPTAGTDANAESDAESIPVADAEPLTYA